MSDKKLNNLLNDLRSEIDRLQRVDAPSQARLDKLFAAIQTKVGDHQKSEEEGFFEELDESIKEFEATHPTLTRILNNIMTTLSNTGI